MQGIANYARFSTPSVSLLMYTFSPRNVSEKKQLPTVFLHLRKLPITKESFVFLRIFLRSIEPKESLRNYVELPESASIVIQSRISVRIIRYIRNPFNFMEL